MANKKYYTSEVIEFQNGDHTIAKPLTLKKLKAFSEVYNEYAEAITAVTGLMEELTEKAKAEGNKDPNPGKLYEAAKEAGELPDDFDEGPSYLDTLISCALIALSRWGVVNDKQKAVTVDVEYIEDELDIPTITRICEIAGSMQLGETQADEAGKAEG